MMISAPTFSATIYIAGCGITARQICREYCGRGLCVHVINADYIYTGGAETGVIIGLINYPRFPADPATIKEMALDLAERLRLGLHQQSFTVVMPEETIWVSYREAAP